MDKSTAFSLTTTVMDYELEGASEMVPGLIEMCNDAAIIVGLDDVYGDIHELIEDGWHGTYLYVVLDDSYYNLDMTTIRALEDGILMVKDRKALVWSSRFVVLLTYYTEKHFKDLHRDEIRKLSPRTTEVS